MQDAYFRPAAAERFRNDGLRAPVCKRMPHADDQLCFGWGSSVHSLDLMCRHERKRPTTRPRPTVPTMKGTSDRDGKPRENDQSNGDDSAGARSRHAEPAVSANVAWFA